MDCVALGSHYASWPLEPLAGAARRGAPPRRPGSDLSRARPAPTRNRPPRPRAVAGPAPVPGPVVPARPGPRARRVTRENVPRPASTSLNPRARLLEVRARGSRRTRSRAASPTSPRRGAQGAAVGLKTAKATDFSEEGRRERLGRHGRGRPDPPPPEPRRRPPRRERAHEPSRAHLTGAPPHRSPISYRRLR